MSRIDQALRIWESGTNTKPSEPGDSQSASSSALSDYPREDATERPAAVTSLHAANPKPAEGLSVSGRRTSTRIGRLPNNPDLQARLVTGVSTTLSVEQYRRLAVVLHEEQVDRQLKTVMITSALPQEGKTLTLVNLALTLSESYERRVLVIDADLRCPSVHTLLDIPNERGLSEALRDNHQLPFISVSSRLSALTAGYPGPRPLARLSSTQMTEVVAKCAAEFDWVLIDTPPVGVLPDAQVLARLAGAVIFVIRAGSTPAAAVQRAIAELGPDSIIGTVLNHVDERQVPEAGYYSHYGTGTDRR